VDAANIFVLFLAAAFLGLIVYLAVASRRERIAQAGKELDSSVRPEAERQKKAA
jgi:hypothetical protein